MMRALALLLPAALAIPCAPLGAAEPVQPLLTEEEARQLRLTDEEWEAVERARRVWRGPRITVHRPQVEETRSGPLVTTASPADLDIEFEANLADVDMSSLKVVARLRRTPFKKNLTDRIAPYLSGPRVSVSGLPIPSGRFLLKIGIADVEGRPTELDLRLNVE